MVSLNKYNFVTVNKFEILWKKTQKSFSLKRRECLKM